MSRESIRESLELIFEGITKLKGTFEERQFTIDGRLVGDIGEVLAAMDYDVKLDAVGRAVHDGVTSCGRDVQVKATFKDSLTFSRVPQLYLGFRLNRDGTYEEIFNGPGKVIYDHFASRKGIGVKLLSLPIRQLKELNKVVSGEDRVKVRLITATEESEAMTSSVGDT